MNLNELLKKLSEDKAFAANYEGLELDAWLEQAKKDGCELTREEVLAYLAEARTGELSDDELDAVAGGLFPVILDMPYMPIQQQITIEPLPVTGGPITVQQLPFSGKPETAPATAGKTFSV